MKTEELIEFVTFLENTAKDNQHSDSKKIKL
jgi:hypothetical protein